MLLREGELALFMLRSPNLPIPAVFSVPSVLIYNTREAPYVRHLPTSSLSSLLSYNASLFTVVDISSVDH